MIFTRNQYATARTEHASFYRLLDALVMTNTVLMIGVGLDDPDFRLLFEDNRARFQNALPHYMTFGGSPHIDLIQTARETMGIKLLPYSSKQPRIIGRRSEGIGDKSIRSANCSYPNDGLVTSPQQGGSPRLSTARLEAAATWR